MAFTRDELDDIYLRTSGYCHLCHKKMARKNYGKVGVRGAWEVEHSNPRANGGSDSLNNLYAACIPCNRSKGKRSTRSVRAENGKTRAPLSPKKRKQAQVGNAVIGGLAGAALGCVLGPVGAVVVSAVGARLGYRRNPDK